MRDLISRVELKDERIIHLVLSHYLHIKRQKSDAQH